MLDFNLSLVEIGKGVIISDLNISLRCSLILSCRHLSRVGSSRMAKAIETAIAKTPQSAPPLCCWIGAIVITSQTI